jgi:hypothetical protein
MFIAEGSPDFLIDQAGLKGTSKNFAFIVIDQRCDSRCS